MALIRRNLFGSLRRLHPVQMNLNDVDEGPFQTFGTSHSANNVANGNSPADAGNTSSIEEATLHLLQHLNSNAHAIEERISEARALLRCSTSPKECVHGAFDVLAGPIFGDRLGGHTVQVGVMKGMGADESGRTYARGVKAAGVAIYVSYDFVSAYLKTWAGGQDRVLAVLMHQLIHAYFAVSCGAPPEEAENGVDERLRHGVPFAAILYKIRQISGLKGHPRLPLAFGHSAPRPNLQQLAYNDEVDHLEALMRTAAVGDERRFRTACTAEVEAVTEQKVMRWVRLGCPNLDPLVYEVGPNGSFTCRPHSKCGNCRNHILLRWNNRYWRVDRQDLGKNCPSLQRHFPNPASYQPLDIGDDVSEPHFKEFFTFCTAGSYGARLPLSITQCDQGIAPPLILDFKNIPTWPTYLVTDVTLHKLGQALNLPELRAFALSRLEAQHVTYEDPLTVLSTIFELRPVDTSGSGVAINATIGSVEPSEELRAWAASWIRRVRPLSVGDIPLSMSNWARINAHRSTGRLASLLERCGPSLAAELARAGDELALLPVEKPPMPGSVLEVFPHLAAVGVMGGGGGGGGLQGYYGAMPQQMGHWIHQSPSHFAWGRMKQRSSGDWEIDVANTDLRAVWRDERWVPGLRS